MAHSNGHIMVNGATAPSSDHSDVHIHPVPSWTPLKKLKVITIGAGFSGLILAHKLQHQYPEFQNLVTHQIYEARGDIGGTWLVNRYPGAQCDVPAHIYAFPFDPKTDWTHFYATGQDVHEYMKTTVTKWNLDRDVRLNHRVTETVWQEELGQSKVTVQNGDRTFVEHADLLISAQGVLSKWYWPDIKGLSDFKGHKCHSAQWDEQFDYSGKTIAVIGNGSSGVQIVPKLAALPGTRVISFQRSPNYVYTPFTPAILLGKDDDAAGNPVYTETEKQRFRDDPDFHRAYRRKMIQSISANFTSFLKDSPGSHARTKAARQQMASKLQHDPSLRNTLIPAWSLGCRRITPGEGYLEALQRENVQVVASEVTHVSADSVTAADGQTFKVDVIACATGFDVSLRPQWRMIGRNGVDLAQKWAIEPESYLSLAVRDMPNYFMFLGPNAVVGHGSLVEAINWSADYMLKWIRKVATENIRSVVVKTGVVDELIGYGDELHKSFVWADTCKSWFKNNRVDGRNTALFAGSALSFKQLVSELRPEDFEITYRDGNRWSFLGNGFTQEELLPDSDLAWYVER